jgi:putative oxygen-independent coproporphyrinogen III oxidase
MAGIYVHIPFCQKLCGYCDFYRTTRVEHIESYIEALGAEIELRSGYLEEEEVTTVYFGGGTPSLLSPGQLGVILGALGSRNKIVNGAEITIELNPDDVTAGYMAGLKEAGFNRISIGVQSWSDATLKMLGRRHDSARAVEAVNLAVATGFSDISVDLIYGLPRLTTGEWEQMLDRTFSLPVTHLSAYHLTIEEGTPFGKMKKQGLISEPDEDESSSQFSMLIEKATAAGFIHYEISNFGREGFFSKHNTSYWKQVPYLGLGPSAHSFNGYSRQWNVSDLSKYIAALKKGKLLFEIEELDLRTRFNEYILTSLRTMWGIDLTYVEAEFEKEGYDYITNLAAKFMGYGLMKQEKNSLILTDQGVMIADNIISEFIMA